VTSGFGGTGRSEKVVFVAAGAEAETVDFVSGAGTCSSVEGLQPVARRPSPAANEIDPMMIVFTGTKLRGNERKFLEASQGITLLATSFETFRD
jgi:hypothetical protein